MRLTLRHVSNLNANWYCSSASARSCDKDFIMASFLSTIRSNVCDKISISLHNSVALAVMVAYENIQDNNASAFHAIA